MADRLDSSRFAAAFCHNPRTIRIKHKPRKILQTENDKNFRIDISVATCVHGFLTPDKKQPASLIVFAVQFVCLAKKGAFNRIQMDLDFEDVDGSDNPSYPEIIAHAPYIHEEEHNISYKQIKRMFKKDFTTHADIALVAGKAGISETITKQNEESFIKRYSGKAASSTRVDKKTGKQSGVWWNVKKSTDPDKSEDGINSNHHFAVLLTRVNKSDFQVRVRLFVDAGWRYLAENGGSKVKKIDGKSPDLRFSPELWYEGKCEGIDRKRLGIFHNDGKLTELTKQR
jgi:hypothetical protein